MRIFLLTALSVFCYFSVIAQCPSSLISPTNFSITEVSSEASANPATSAIDDDPTTFWRTEGSFSFPHQIMIDLGAIHAVNQLQILSRQDIANGKLLDFEVYTSMDGTDWGAVQAKGTLPYTSADDVSAKTIKFGTVDAQYVRLVGLSNQDASNLNYRLLIAEISIYEDLQCGATGQINQHINFSAIGNALTTDAPFQLWSTSSSGLPVSYEVVSGSGTISGDFLTPGDQEGPVVVRAIQEGDGTYYPAENFRVFNLIDPANYSPEITTRLTDAYPIEMDDLYGYPFYANASIEHPDLLNVTDLTFEIQGVPYPAEYQDGAYVFWWEPPYYGDFNVNIIATASNGISTEKEMTLTVSKPTGDKTLITFEDNLIDFNSTGRTYQNTYQLPQFVGTYDIVFANFWVDCPNIAGGCDDWDRLAYIQIKAPNGEWVEFIRYITPYGVACAHTLDLTDYASLLQGEVEIRVTIDTWGTGGWDVNLQLNYERGNPEYLYSKVDVLWAGSYPFGNYLNPQPMDTLSYSFPENSSKAKMLLVTTGHGWGDNNSNNAAEFFRALHHIKVNDVNTFEQDLWMDCNPNPDACTGQLGTWEFNRAGWCPGAIGKNYEYDFTPYITQSASNPIELSYIFQDNYIDFCNASHPDCVSGVTCDNCDDGFNPNYRIRGHMITKTNVSLATNTKEISTLSEGFKIVPNPSDGHFFITSGGASTFNGPVSVILQSLDGKLLREYDFQDVSDLDRREFSLSELASGTYWVRLVGTEKVATLKWIKQ